MLTREEAIRWARESGVKLPDGPFPARGSFSLPELMGLCGQAHAAGAAAERAACIDDCNAEARDDGTAQRIVERIRARSHP
jgi:hypothetical protein